MTALGRHLILELRDCNPERLNDLPFIERVMLEAARRANATILSHQFRRFEPQGVSGIVIIAESHLAIHTWPEYGYAAVDVYTCGETLRPEVAAAHLVKALECSRPYVISIKRGLLEDNTVARPQEIIRLDEQGLGGEKGVAQTVL